MTAIPPSHRHTLPGAAPAWCERSSAPCRPRAARILLVGYAALLAGLLVSGVAAGDDPPPEALSRMGTEEFNRKYKAYLVNDHVGYVSTEFAEKLIPVTQQVLEEFPEFDLGSVEFRILVADRLYEHFSPSQFDEIADFPRHPGPGDQSLNAWVKSLQKSIVIGDTLKVRKPLAWWPVYLGVSEAFDKGPVVEWARRKRSRVKASIGEIIVKAVLRNAIYQRYKSSAENVFTIVCAEYAAWLESPESYQQGGGLEQLHQIVLQRLHPEGRDAGLFGD